MSCIRCGLHVVGLSVHGFIEALLAIAKKRCLSSEMLVESFQRLVSSCHAALEDDRRRGVSAPRLAARRRLAPTLSGRVTADVAVSPRLKPSTAAERRQAPRSASSGPPLMVNVGGERTSSLRRLDYRQFSPDMNCAASRRQLASASDSSNQRAKTEQ